MDVKTISEDKATLYFKVTDTGIGITSELLEKIFDPFTQAESGSTRRYGGTGLGLTITKSIIELMGGNISVESTPGVGSSFSFELTLDLEKPDAAAKNVFVMHGNKRPIFDGCVLLCEDNYMNQLVAGEFLVKAGLRVILAENGKAAVETVQARIDSSEKQFDLIFMDMHMPVMDGIGATEAIHALGVKTPIIAMTANVMPDDVANYMKCGLDDCLGKPFASHELWSCLLKYLEPVSWLEERTQLTDVNAPQSLLSKLEKLLKESNADCLSLIDDLRNIPGSEKLIEQIEEFDFKPALQTLAELRKGRNYG